MEAKPKRLYEIAKDLKVDLKLIVQRSAAEGIGPIETQFSPVTADQEKIIRGWFAKPASSSSSSVSNTKQTATATATAPTKVISKGLSFLPKLLRRDASKEAVVAEVPETKTPTSVFAKAKENGQGVAKSSAQVTAVTPVSVSSSSTAPVIQEAPAVAELTIPEVSQTPEVTSVVASVTAEPVAAAPAPIAPSPSPVAPAHPPTVQVTPVTATVPEVVQSPVVSVESPIQEIPAVDSSAQTPTEIQEMPIEVTEPEIQEDSIVVEEFSVSSKNVDDASFDALRIKIAEFRSQATALGQQLQHQAKLLATGRVARIQPLGVEWSSLLQYSANLVASLESMGYSDVAAFDQVVDIETIERAVDQIEGARKQQLQLDKLLQWIQPMAEARAASGAPEHLDVVLNLLRERATQLAAQIRSPEGAATVTKLQSPDSAEPVQVAFDLIHGREPQTEQADLALVEFLGVKRFRQFVQACENKTVLLG